MPARPILLVFTLGPERETRRKALLPAGHESWERALHRRCLERVLDAGRRRGMTLAVSSPDGSAPWLDADAVPLEQGDGAFGRRLRRAEERAFGLGPGPVVLVGADAPELGGAEIDAALEHLASRPDAVVVGPSPDGGFYLLASKRPLASLLEDVSWCTPRARRDLEASLARVGIPVIRLHALRDLDRAADLELWLAGSGDGTDRLVRALLRLLAARRRPPSAARRLPPRRLAPRRPPGRAPPRALAA